MDTQNAHTPRSYHVETKRGSYRRNRKNLVKTHENPINIDRDFGFDDQDGEHIEENTQSLGPQGDDSVPKPYVTPSGRVVRVPEGFKDYVT